MSNEHKRTAEERIVTDVIGRKLKISEPNFMQKAEVTRLCGDDSTNVGYMYGFVMPCCWVTAIDDVPVPFPVTHREILGLMQRVGEEGVVAILPAMQELTDSKK